MTPAGQTAKTLVENFYDGKTLGSPTYPAVRGCATGSGWQPQLAAPTSGYDSSPPVSWGYRGMISATVNPAKTTCLIYHQYGATAMVYGSDGSFLTVSADVATNYAAPQTVSTQSYSETIGYNSWLGVTQTTGMNGEQLLMTYDVAGRPATGTSPYGAVTNFGYTSAVGTTAAKQTKTGPDGFTQTTLDGLGRVTKVERGPGSASIQSVVESKYTPCSCSPLGKLWKVSQPYSPGGSATAWTVYSYDGIGRTLSVVQPDGASTTSYSYAGAQTTVTDPVNKWKTFLNDVEGNLVTVTEPDPANPSTATFDTSYGYDWMKHLTSVNMTRGAIQQTRGFVYDDAGRLTSATNPENGTVLLYYNADGTLQYRHDAKGQETVYSYDGTKRVSTIQRYPAGRNNTEVLCQRVIYTYDTNPAGEVF
jgi:YD repeat-containing protein